METSIFQSVKLVFTDDEVRLSGGSVGFGETPASTALPHIRFLDRTTATSAPQAIE
jgi:hypothetical protein